MPAGLDGWQLAGIIAQAAVYGFSLTAAGGIFFLFLFRRHLEPREQFETGQLSAALAVSALVAGAAELIVMAGRLGGSLASMADSTMLAIVMESGDAVAAAIRSLGLAALGVVGLAIAGSGWPRLHRGLGVLGVLLVCGSFALAGHSRVAAPGSLPEFLVTLHLLAIAYWLGALWPLRRLTYAPDRRRVAVIMKRFGHMAGYIIGILVLAGGGLLWLLLGELSALVTSRYGQLILVKLGLVLGLLGLAAINKWRLVPGLATDGSGAAAALRRAITAECFVAGLVIIATATLTTIAGAPALE